MDVDKVYLDKEFGPEYTSFVKTIGSSKYIPRPQFANKDSHLDKWSSLLMANAPSVLYQQDNLSDLFIPKAFASVLDYAGFYEVAKEVNSKFNDHKYCYSQKDPNYQSIYKFGMSVLPKWLQCSSKNIWKVRWKDIKQFDIFVGGLLGTDSIANHAIAIYNNWIFDGNKKVAIPPCQEGLDYCVSTKYFKCKFVKFTGGFYLRERGDKKQLKRKANGEDRLIFDICKVSNTETMNKSYKSTQKRSKI